MNNARRKWLRSIVEQVETVHTNLETIKDEDLESLRDEEQEAYDNLPYGIQESDRGCRMEDIISEMEDALSSLEYAMDSLNEACEYLISATEQ